MKKLQLAFAALAAIAGVGGAYASQVKPASAPYAAHNWVTAGGTAVPELNGASTATASQSCAGQSGVCLRSTDNAVTLIGAFNG